MTKTPYILIVEDDEWMAEHYQRTLAEAGFRSETVSNALAAIDSLDMMLPDTLVLDLLLVGPNAFTLLHELKSHDDLSSIPVILCTTSASEIAEGDVKAYGICDVLDKAGMAPQDLVVAIKKVLL